MLGYRDKNDDMTLHTNLYDIIFGDTFFIHVLISNLGIIQLNFSVIKKREHISIFSNIPIRVNTGIIYDTDNACNYSFISSATGISFR